MVIADKLFKRLVAVDTLIKFDAVIPSQSEFIEQIDTTIAAFYQALENENKPQLQRQRCCALLCLYFNQAIIHSQHNKGLNFDVDNLVIAADRYCSSFDNRSVQQLLTDLLVAEDNSMFNYAWQLLELFITQRRQPEALVSLHSQYQSRHNQQCLIDEADNRDNGVQQHPMTQEGYTQQVVDLYSIIVGPFAQKWFAEYDKISRKHVMWRVCSASASITYLIKQWKNHHAEKRLTLFLPILVDGLQTTALLNDEIKKIKNIFILERIPPTLPISLAFYTRLSEQQQQNNGNVVWCGSLDFNQQKSSTVAEALAAINTELTRATLHSRSHDVVQREVMASLLEQWLIEEGTLGLLQDLFDNENLNFTGLALADYGKGFSRHGAWSAWIGKHFSLLPGLGTSLVSPPLPTMQPPILVVPIPPAVPPLGTIKRPEVTHPHRDEQAISVTTASPYPASIAITDTSTNPVKVTRRRWPWWILLVVISVSLISFAGYWLSQRQVKQSKAPQTISNNQPLLSLADAMPLFKPGQNTLSAQSTEILNKLAQRILQLPPNAVLLIIGHSDNTGSEKLNQNLSLQRAEIIRDWLIKNYHLPEQRLIVEGKGDKQPIDSNDTETGRAKNRRVEIIPLINQDERK